MLRSSLFQHDNYVRKSSKLAGGTFQTAKLSLKMKNRRIYVRGLLQLATTLERLNMIELLPLKASERM